MQITEALLAAFDDALTHHYESLAEATAKLAVLEAAWQPSAYSVEPHDPGIGRPGSVLWHLNHLLHCHRHYTAVLRERPAMEQPETPRPGELGLAEVLGALTAANAGLRAEIAKLTDGDYAMPCTRRSNVLQFVNAVVRHIAWHSGQIATTRRHFRMQA